MAFDMKLIDAHMIKRSFKSFTDLHLLERTSGTNIPNRSMESCCLLKTIFNLM